MHDKVDLFHFYGHLLSVDASNMFAHSPKPFKINKFSCQINGKHCANLNWVCVCVLLLNGFTNWLYLKFCKRKMHTQNYRKKGRIN